MGRNLYVGRVAIVILVAAVLVVETAAAAPPKRTGTGGTITLLGPNRIAVAGPRNVSCRIGASLSKFVHAFVVGGNARITCLDGLLSAIVRLGPRPVITTSAQSSGNGSVSSSSASVSTSTSTSSAESKVTASVAAAAGPISAIGDGSITVGSIACSIGSSSPDTSGFKVGDRVALQCSNDTLTGLSHTA